MKRPRIKSVDAWAIFNAHDCSIRCVIARKNEVAFYRGRCKDFIVIPCRIVSRPAKRRAKR